MRLREFAPSPRPDGEPSGDFPMTWDQIVDRFRQILTHNLGWRMEAGSGRTASFSKGSMIFIINQYTSPKQIQYYINDGRRQWKGFKFTMWSSITQLLDTVRSLPLKEFAPSPDFSGEPDRFPRIPQKYHKGDIVWVSAPKVKMRSHFPGNAPAVVLGSYDDQYGDDMVYVDVDLDDPDLTPDDRAYYINSAKEKSQQEHQYDIFLLHKNEVGETAWYPETDLVAVPAGTNIEKLFATGNAAPWARVPAKIKRIIMAKLGAQVG